jgi:predicted dehydrogenase
MDKIRIGQVGICHEHASGKINSLRRLSDVYEIVGVVDDRNTAAARFAGDDLRPYEGLTWLTEEELFATPGLQAVTIETPNTDLVPTAMRCMERGLAMHMDKPGGEDFAAFDALLDGCKARNVPLQMGYMFRSNPAVRFCRDAIRKKWLGEVFEIHATMSHDYGGDAYPAYLAKFRGGIMFNLGCHLVDLVVSIMGRPDNVTPFLTSAPGTPEDSMNNALAVLEYPHAHVVLNASCLEVEGLPHRRFKLCGTKGTVELTPLERFDGQPLTLRLTLLEDNEEYAAGTHTVDAGIEHDRYEDQLLELARIINGEITAPYTYAHDRLVQEVVLAASGYAKWKKG